MDLKDFITKTISDIIDGVNDSKSIATSKNCIINPVFFGSDKASKDVVSRHTINGRQTVTSIDFDVALTVSNTSELGLDGGVTIPMLKVGSKGSVADKYENVSRVKFSINIVLPTTDVD